MKDPKSAYGGVTSFKVEVMDVCEGDSLRWKRKLAYRDRARASPNTRNQMPGKPAKPKSPGSGWVHWPGPLSPVSQSNRGQRGREERWWGYMSVSSFGPSRTDPLPSDRDKSSAGDTRSA